MRFFVLDDIVGSPTETEHSDWKPIYGDAPRCLRCGDFIGSLTWQPPYQVELMRHGKCFGDVSFGPGNDLLVSATFQGAWLKEDLSGIARFDPVEVMRVRPRKAARSAPTYLHVAVPSSLTPIDEKRSILLSEGAPRCDFCRSGASLTAILGFSIDETLWTGEDIFRPRKLPGRIVVTERVRDLAQAYNLANVNLIPVEDFRTSYGAPLPIPAG